MSNGKTLHLFGDGRSAAARRFRDLLRNFTAEYGADTASNGQRLRRLTSVSLELETMEARRVAGEQIDPVAFVTLVNAQRRLLRDLDAHRTKPRQLSLAEQLAAERASRVTQAQAA